jgi:microcin C transport system substrate-binding protein
MVFYVILLLIGTGLSAQTDTPKTITAASLSLLGPPKYQDGFARFDYVNPDAPKRGSITRYAVGTYDNFHRYASRGDICAGWEYFYDTLMTGSADEYEVYYPLVAEKVEYAEDYSFIIFYINPGAKDQDGQSITAEDAAFSFNIIKTKGVEHARKLYADITAVPLPGNKVRFDFPKEEWSKEKLLDIAGLPVFPKRFWEQHNFSEPLLAPPVGTGPYRVKDYRMGQYVILERIKDYWAADLPVRKGLFNFDIIRYDYYRDSNVAFEAFKAGEYDFREENSAKNWATEYTGKIFDSGALVREEIQHTNPPSYIQGLTFNVQSPVFSDWRVRRAVSYFFDFQWMNKNLFYGQYRRLKSYFQSTDYAATGLPSTEELSILEPIRDKIPQEVFTEEFNPPEYDGTGNIRSGMRSALKLFASAGWVLRDGVLRDVDGKQMSFELMIWSPSSERLAIPFQRNLARFGIDMRIRLVDSSQFLRRMWENDYDLIDQGYSMLYYPSSMTRLYWHSKYIDSTYNRAGVHDPALDYLVEGVMAHQDDPETLLYWGRALDRVALWNHYIIPEWYSSAFRLAYKKNLKHPKALPKYSYAFDAWWSE